MSLATLKTKIEQLIDNSKYLNCLVENYQVGLSKYFVPSKKTDWSNLLHNRLTNSVSTTIESKGSPTSLNCAFQYNRTPIIIIDFDTSQVQDYSNAFEMNLRGILTEIQGELDFTSCTIAAYCFNACSKLKEIRFKENSISYSMWDLDFSATDDLSEESLLSIANAFIPTPDDVTDGKNGYIVFSSYITENMPNYIKEIFLSKRVELG